MKREIKFRVFEKKIWKCMLYGEIGARFPWDYSFEDGESRAWLTKEWGKPGFEVMQYTGLKDKNGKEIYEGDVLYYKKGVRFIIKWSLGRARFYGQMTEPRENYMANWEKSIEWVAPRCEIIGNIYENPELLKS